MAPLSMVARGTPTGWVIFGPVLRNRRAPEHSILPILKCYAGRCIRLVAMRDGVKLREATVNVPGSMAAINQLFRQVIYWSWIIDSEQPLLHVGDVMMVLPGSVIMPGARRAQAFAHGITHCLFEPIRQWCLQQRDGA